MFNRLMQMAKRHAFSEYVHNKVVLAGGFLHNNATVLLSNIIS
jgi:hypothetical protein